VPQRRLCPESGDPRAVPRRMAICSSWPPGRHLRQSAQCAGVAVALSRAAVAQSAVGIELHQHHPGRARLPPTAPLPDRVLAAQQIRGVQNPRAAPASGGLASRRPPLAPGRQRNRHRARIGEGRSFKSQIELGAIVFQPTCAPPIRSPLARSGAGRNGGGAVIGEPRIAPTCNRPIAGGPMNTAPSVQEVLSSGQGELLMSASLGETG